MHYVVIRQDGTATNTKHFPNVGQAIQNVNINYKLQAQRRSIMYFVEK
jgi:hypothetical protein